MFAIIMFLSSFIITTLLILLFTFGFKNKKVKKKEIASLEETITNKDSIAFQYLMYQLITFKKSNSLRMHYPDLRQYCLDKDFKEAVNILDELNY